MPQSLKDDYYPNILASATIDGKIISTPWFNSPYALFYNKTLMEKAGITEVPRIAPAMEYARKISALGVDENGNKIYGYALTNSKTRLEPAITSCRICGCTAVICSMRQET